MDLWGCIRGRGPRLALGGKRRRVQTVEAGLCWVVLCLRTGPRGMPFTFWGVCTVPEVAWRMCWPCRLLGPHGAAAVAWLCGSLRRGPPSVVVRMATIRQDRTRGEGEDFFYLDKGKRDAPGLSIWTEFCAELHTFCTACPSRGKPAGWRWCCACRCDTWPAPGSVAPSHRGRGTRRYKHRWRWSVPDGGKEEGREIK